MKKIIMASLLGINTLLLSPAAINAVAVDLGPFSFRLNTPVTVNDPAFKFYNDPICRAILERKLIVMNVQKGDQFENVVFEPYAFGYNDKGELILQGFQVEQVELNNSDDAAANGGGYFGGVFSTFKGSEWTDINVDKVIGINIIEESNFAVRENVLEHIQADSKITDPICILHP